MELVSRRRKQIITSGALIRVVLVLLIIPTIHRDLFHPFIQYWWKDPTFDPWTQWLAEGGRPDAFPYGVTLGLPMFLLGGMSLAASTLVVGISAAILDTFISLRLARVVTRDWTLVLWALGPLPVFVTYVHGQTDLFLAFFLSASLGMLFERRWVSAGVLLALAGGVKLSALLVAPFALIFFLDNPRFRRAATRFFVAFLCTSVVLQIPAIYSPGYRAMAVRSPEGVRLLDYRLVLRDDYALLVLPVIYLGLVYGLWRLGRALVGSLVTYSAVAVMALAVVTPGSVGWYLWSFPVLVFLVDRLQPRVLILAFAFELLVVAHYIRRVSLGDLRFGSVSLNPSFISLTTHQEDLLATALLSVAALVLVAVLRRSAECDDKFSLAKKPLSIAVAGDSSTGKDTLAQSIGQIFPSRTVQVLNGDDYHRFERGHSAWRRLTHLNPAANDLVRQQRDVSMVLRRQAVHIREYSHFSGKFTDPRRLFPADVVIVNGLHSLLLEPVRESFDARIFLEMQESLRVALKVERDGAHRATSREIVLSTIEARRGDYYQFVEPQRRYADLCLTIESSIAEVSTLDFNSSSDIRVKIVSSDPRFVEMVFDSLSSVCLARCVQQDEDTLTSTLIAWPCELSSSENKWLLHALAGEIGEITESQPTFASGLRGFMASLCLGFALWSRTVGGHV